MQTNRLYFIDAVRAFAILMMLQGHFIDTLIAPVYKNSNSVIYSVWSYFRGITAPVFFTISGLVFTYLLLRANFKGDDSPRIKKGFFRGLLLIVIGYSLRVNLLSWLSGNFNDYFFVVDVLQCIGLSLIILVSLHILFKNYSYVFSSILLGLGSVCFVLEPLYRDLFVGNLPVFIANYITKTNGSVFTILPWFGYSAFGAFIATVFFRHGYKEKFKLITLFAFFVFGYLLINYSSWLLKKMYHITDIDLFMRSANYNYLFTRLGNVFILFGFFYMFERFLKQSILTKIGEKTLSIYVIHFILLYGSFTGCGLKRFFYQSLNITEVIIGAILFIISTCIISFYYAKTNTFLYNMIRKLIRSFK